MAAQNEENPVRASHWSAVAQHWQLVGSPLRPSPADCAVYTQVVQRWAAQHGGPRSLILGVTPELYRLPWPNESTLLAVDHTQAMIDALWPGPKGSALNAEWTDIPVPDALIDIALCDGGLHLLAYPEQQGRLVQSLARVVAPEGLVLVRLFVPPLAPETPEQVLRALGRGEVPNLNVLKLRLGMALQPSTSAGVELGRVWTALHQRHPDWASLAQKLNWDLAHLQAIDTYKNCPARYHFASIEQVQALFCSSEAGFELVSVQACSYDLGDRCPIVVFRRGR